ncbi:NAD(P)H-dependent oxidoreductase [Caldimonas tepidiphila]|uniref:glutathione-regulated potassium-efflux system oxidoreductase KefF n=1 Tax=Caldimonas tepidiphila TaxID=2315841 RepID=UPI000E5A9517|nr:NAD(P)H-dependent oxidoreductase [Caldimonas tepidiphila]
MPHVLVLAAHPDLRVSRVNRRLLAAARSIAGERPQRLEVRELYALYPDFAIDVAAEQAAAARADLIVWQHPMQWYAMPALMKLWVDEVLAHGWAYGRGGSVLAGKDLWPVLSTGGSERAYRPDGYNRHFFDAFLPPYEQTAALCGMRMLPPMVLHGAHAADDAEIASHAAVYAERLRSYPDWPEIESLDPCPQCDVPAADRPASPAKA